jgi:formamidopyrimidine-DNA glycosylase
MPELPDVEVYKRYLDSSALHQRIDHVHVESPEILSGTTPQGLGRALKGQSFDTSCRHGKYLFIALDKTGWLVLHFGMSGRLDYFKHNNGEPDYTRCLFSFDNGFDLAYIAPRKLGHVALTNKAQSFIINHMLGPDAYGLSEAQFLALAAGHHGTIKGWLMNQKIMAGIGNIYSDEMLFRTGIHPKQSMDKVDQNALKRLYNALHSVLETAINAQADPGRMPSSFLLSHRKAGEHCPKCGTEIAMIKVSGRSAWYCPSCQQLK